MGASIHPPCTSRRRQRRARGGLALVEVLICASIAAMLLTATSVAFRSSIMTYRDNTDRNLLLSQGRLSMRQLVTEIRLADSHWPINDALVPTAQTLFAQGLTVENTGIKVQKTQPDTDDPGVVPGNSSTYVTITWAYDADHFQLVRTKTVGNGTPTSTVMASYVKDFKVRLEPGRSAANVATGNPSYDILLRATVSMVLQNVDGGGKMIFNQGSGQVTERILDAAVPRKNFSGL